jgi:elongation factor G
MHWSRLILMGYRYNVPTRIVFLNKLDRPGASFKSSLLSLISHRLHPNPMVLTIPISSHDPQDYKQATPGIQGLVDLVHWEIWMWGKNGTLSRHPLPRNIEDLPGVEILPHSHPILPHLVPARTALLENLSMFSEEFMSFLLDSSTDSSSYLNIDTSTIIHHLRTATLRNEILPVLCGSATKHIGTELTMDYIGQLLASPMDVEKNGQLTNQPLRLLAWKVCWDKKRGWMTFVRVYAGVFYCIARWYLLF